jgi:hypothetical protein
MGKASARIIANLDHRLLIRLILLLFMCLPFNLSTFQPGSNPLLRFLGERQFKIFDGEVPC